MWTRLKNISEVVGTATTRNFDEFCREHFYIVRKHIDTPVPFLPGKDFDTFHESFFAFLWFGNIVNCYPFLYKWENDLEKTIFLYKRVCSVCHILYLLLLLLILFNLIKKNLLTIFAKAFHLRRVWQGCKYTSDIC